MSVLLSHAQQSVVAHEEGSLLVLAGPGAGKTRVLTERVRRLIQSAPGHFRVLALTFTNKAANEMIERLGEVPEIDARAFVGTFHSFCMEVVENRGRSVGIYQAPHIFESFDDRKRVLLDALLTEPDLSDVLAQSSSTSTERERKLTEWLRQIGEWKNDLLLPEMLSDPLEQRLYNAYDAGLRASNAVDFDDLLLLTYRIFEEAPRVVDLYRRQFPFICIDEAQDLNEAQYRVLCALCANEHRNVMLVGDPKQAIYTWRGASPEYLDLFVRDFDAKVIELHENFRSSRAVVAAATALNEVYEIEGQLPIEGGLELIRAENEDAEAAIVVERIQDLLSGGHQDVEGPISLERCAVLGRTRFVFPAVEKRLKDANLEFYTKMSQATHAFSSDVFNELQLALRIMANPHDRMHLGLLASRWNLAGSASEVRDEVRELEGDEIIGALAAESSNPRAHLVLDSIKAMQWSQGTVSLSRGLDALCESVAKLSDREERMAIELDVYEWRLAWNQFLRGRSSGGRSAEAFLTEFALGSTEQAFREGLALLTVHSAKGMEFDVVFVIGLCEGVLPDYRAKGEALAEEARNAFVAVTRSKRLLYLSYPRERMMPWGEVQAQRPSRFFRAIQRVASS